MKKYTIEDHINSLTVRLLKNRSVNSTTQCWEWTAAKTQDGYRILGSTIEGSNSVFAHRASWIVNHGTIPKGLVICHHCDNPPCFNPDHLWLGTSTENMIDMALKGRNRLATMWNERVENSCNNIAQTLKTYNLLDSQIDEILKTINTHLIKDLHAS